MEPTPLRFTTSDVVIAADDATFGLPEIDRGAMGAATHLRRLFPEQATRLVEALGLQ